MGCPPTSSHSSRHKIFWDWPGCSLWWALMSPPLPPISPPTPCQSRSSPVGCPPTSNPSLGQTREEGAVYISQEVTNIEICSSGTRSIPPFPIQVPDRHWRRDQSIWYFIRRCHDVLAEMLSCNRHCSEIMTKEMESSFVKMRQLAER